MPLQILDNQSMMVDFLRNQVAALAPKAMLAGKTAVMPTQDNSTSFMQADGINAGAPSASGGLILGKDWGVPEDRREQSLTKKGGSNMSSFMKFLASTGTKEPGSFSGMDYAGMDFGGPGFNESSGSAVPYLSGFA